jgi:hypothetical protein
MHKTLRMVRELLPQAAPSTKPEAFSTDLLNVMIAPYAVLDRNRLSLCFGTGLWSNMICDLDFTNQFSPATNHADILEGYMGKYRDIPMYTDAFEDPSSGLKFLPPQHLVLAMLTEDQLVDALLRLDLLSYQPKVNHESTVTQLPSTLVVSRAELIARLVDNPEQPYWAEVDENTN